jgi:predicted O-methyltransferase YrrM
MDDNIFERVDNYIADLLAPQDKALAETLQTIKHQNIENASISANQGKFLQILAIACNAKRILELGTLGGYSTIWLARALPNDGILISIECNSIHAELAQKNINNAGLENIVDLKIGKAMDILPKMIVDKESPFDFIFIDADKPPYTEYFIFALQLSRPGTIIVCDNVIRNGNVIGEDISDEKVNGVRRLNSFLAGCSEVSATILQTVGVKEHDGMVVAVVNNNCESSNFFEGLRDKQTRKV